MTKRAIGDDAGTLRAIEAVRVELAEGRLREVPGSSFEIPCDLLLLAMGFVGVEPSPLYEQLGVTIDARGNVAGKNGRTNVSGVFTAGDAQRGASLVVWSIAEGRKVADAVHDYLQHQPMVMTAP
jgi:glutamate synthase (NADPH) small chain